MHSLTIEVKSETSYFPHGMVVRLSDAPFSGRRSTEKDPTHRHVMC